MKKFLSNYILEILLAILIPLIIFCQFGRAWNNRKSVEITHVDSKKHPGLDSILAMKQYNIRTTIMKNHATTVFSVIDTLKPFDVDTLSVLLPHLIYQRKKDSLEKIQNVSSREYSKSFSGPGGGISKRWIYMDAKGKKLTQADKEEINKDYYLILPQYFLKEEDEHKSDVIYHVQNKQAFLRVYDYKKDGTENFMIRKDMPVFFKIDPTNRAVLIPLTKKQYHISSIAIWSFALTFIFLGILVTTKAAKFLIAIARGKVFIEKNVTRLRDIAIISIVAVASTYII